MADRDERGRFLPGSQVGKLGGRKPYEIEWRALTIIRDIPAETWEMIRNKAIQQALRGDWRAREWLSNYTLGKPVQSIDINAHTDQVTDVIDVHEELPDMLE